MSHRPVSNKLPRIHLFAAAAVVYIFSFLPEAALFLTVSVGGHLFLQKTGAGN